MVFEMDESKKGPLCRDGGKDENSRPNRGRKDPSELRNYFAAPTLNQRRRCMNELGRDGMVEALVQDDE